MAGCSDRNEFCTGTSNSDQDSIQDESRLYMDCGPDDDEHDVAMMHRAFEMAKRALQQGEVPVGAVLVRQKSVVAMACNATNASLNASRHAELEIIDLIRNTPWFRVEGLKFCTLFVTCEPCVMCAGALVQLGLARAVFGCGNDKFGGCGSLLHVQQGFLADRCWPGTRVRQGVMQADAVDLFQQFFRRQNMRAPNKKNKRKRPETEEGGEAEVPSPVHAQHKPNQ